MSKRKPTDDGMVVHILLSPKANRQMNWTLKRIGDPPKKAVVAELVDWFFSLPEIDQLLILGRLPPDTIDMAAEQLRHNAEHRARDRWDRRRIEANEEFGTPEQWDSLE